MLDHWLLLKLLIVWPVGQQWSAPSWGKADPEHNCRWRYHICGSRRKTKPGFSSAWLWGHGWVRPCKRSSGIPQTKLCSSVGSIEGWRCFCIYLALVWEEERVQNTAYLLHSSVTLAEGPAGFLLQIKQPREDILTFPYAVLKPVTTSSVCIVPHPCHFGGCSRAYFCWSPPCWHLICWAQTHHTTNPKELINF